MGNIFTRFVNCVRGEGASPHQHSQREELIRLYKRSEEAAGPEPYGEMGAAVAGSLAAPSMPERAALPDWCIECGVRVHTPHLVDRFQGTVTLFEDGTVGLPSFETVPYCQFCVPAAPIVFILRDSKGEVLDERHFSVKEGWLQDVNEETGEDRYIVSVEEYMHTICERCGGYVSDDTRCKDCRKPRRKTTEAST